MTGLGTVLCFTSVAASIVVASLLSRFHHHKIVLKLELHSVRLFTHSLCILVYSANLAVWTMR